jgi:hypothetical protein
MSYLRTFAPWIVFSVFPIFTIRYVARARARGRAAASAEQGSAAEHAGALDQRPGDGRR